MTKFKFRWHRGGFTESMSTETEFETVTQLFECLQQEAQSPIKHVLDVSIDRYGGVDPRNGWDTHIVMVHGYPVGFTDRQVDIWEALP